MSNGKDRKILNIKCHVSFAMFHISHVSCMIKKNQVTQAAANQAALEVF